MAMDLRLVGAMLAALLLAGCGGGFELGGPTQTQADNRLVGADPGDKGTINSGVGDVIN